jgi:hypothetical protein
VGSRREQPERGFYSIENIFIDAWNKHAGSAVFGRTGSGSGVSGTVARTPSLCELVSLALVSQAFNA